MEPPFHPSLIGLLFKVRLSLSSDLHSVNQRWIHHLSSQKKKLWKSLEIRICCNWKFSFTLSHLFPRLTGIYDVVDVAEGCLEREIIEYQARGENKMEKFLFERDWIQDELGCVQYDLTWYAVSIYIIGQLIIFSCNRKQRSERLAIGII